MAVFYDNPALRNYWYAVATDLEVASGPVARTLLGEALVLYKDPQGRTIAAPDRCPHREAPLSAGSVDRGVLTCCYHGWRFGDDGQCVAIPSAEPDFPIPGNSHLSCFRSEVKYGLVWVCLGEPVADIPAIAQEEDSSFRRINNPVQVWKSSALRMTDNFLDIAHFPWVHVGTFGNGQDAVVPKIKLETLSDGFYGYQYSVIADNPPAASLTSGQDTADVNRRMSTGFHLPFAIRSTIVWDTGSDHILLLLSAPVDDVTSLFTFVFWRNDDFSVSAEDLATFDRMIGEEDRVML
ncbi:MAG: aromatic ring-hydroxylating dioxygenase subunit alpha, partial [Gammaproteobacteria bacterium]